MMDRKPTNYKSKIIGGKLVTVYDDNPDPAYCSNDSQLYQDYARKSQSMPSGINQVNDARLEAKRNKERALMQTYRSVLSPEPTNIIQKMESFGDDLSMNNNYNVSSVSIDVQIINVIGLFSRYKLLTVLSALRRRDPQETGILYQSSIQDVLDICGVFFNADLLNHLFRRYSISESAVDYRRMWKFIMDCYANKDKFSIPKCQSYPEIPTNVQSYPMYKSFSPSPKVPYQKITSADDHYIEATRPAVSRESVIPPGLKAELEFQLRHYARINQGIINLTLLKNRLRDMDLYQTGKLLHKSVLVSCQECLSTMDMDVLSASISACDVDKSGLVNYNLFLSLLENSQPTYLPPIASPTPIQLTSLQCKGDSYSLSGYKDSSIGDSGNSVDSSNDVQKLVERGTLGLHLSDFETEVHQRKSPTSKKLSRPSTYRKDKCDNVNTYKLPHTPTYQNEHSGSVDTINSEISHFTLNEYNKKPVSSPLMDTNAMPYQEQSKLINESKTLKKNTRKQWHETNEANSINLSRDECNTVDVSFGLRNLKKEKSLLKDEKWWKYEVDSDDLLTEEENKWCQSNRIKTIKGKRKRKKKIDVNKQDERIRKDKHGASSDTEVENTDMDSAFYTTTDFEVDEKVCEKKRAMQHLDRFEEPDNLNPVADITDIKNEGSISEEVCERLHLECVTPTPEIGIMKESEVIETNRNSFIVYPSFSKELLKENKSEEKRLCLEYINGYDGGALYCVFSGELVFYVGNTVVIMDSDKLKQRFFKKHNTRITCLALHQDYVTLASSQRKGNKNCIIYVWNCVDLSVLSTIFIDSSNGLYVSTMAFSKNSLHTSFLITIVNDSDKENICIYDWKNSSLKHVIQTSNVSGLISSSEETLTFVTYGKFGHVMFYKLVDDKLVGTNGDFGDLPIAKNIGCAIFDKVGNLITGDSNGALHVWSSELHRIDHCIHNAHTGPIVSLIFTPHHYLLTGCSKDSIIHSWDSTMKCVGSVVLANTYASSRVLCVHETNLFVASSCNSIVKVALQVDGEPLQCSKDNVISISEGPPDIIMDMEVHPIHEEMVIILSADGTVQMYNSESKCVVWTMNVKGNGSTVTFHPLEEFVAVGCQDGSVHLVSSMTGCFVDKFKDSHVAVSYLCFSPSGMFLATGFSNGQISIYSFDGANKELELCHSYQILKEKIKAIDWTENDGFIRAQSCKDLEYYDTNAKKCVKNKDEFVWSSINCSISYEISGGWKSNVASLENFIFTVLYRSNHVIFSSQGLLCMLKCPWTKEKAKYTSTPSGFEGANPILCPSADGSKLFVAFNIGGTLWQWNIH